MLDGKAAVEPQISNAAAAARALAGRLEALVAPVPEDETAEAAAERNQLTAQRWALALNLMANLAEYISIFDTDESLQTAAATFRTVATEAIRRE